MGLKEDFEKQGNWLFRWRSYLPLIMIVFIITGIEDANPSGAVYRLSVSWMIFCLVICYGGILVRLFTAATTPRGTSGRNTRWQEAKTLNTKGIYSVVRHPLYVGNFLIWLGVILSIRSWWFVAVGVYAFWVYYERIMFAEEAFLERQFGDEFRDWASRTPAFIPNFKKWDHSGMELNLWAGLGSEYGGIFGIIIVFTVLDMAQDYLANGRLKSEIGWLYAFCGGLVVYLILRFFKKKTNFLDKSDS